MSSGTDLVVVVVFFFGYIVLDSNRPLLLLRMQSNINENIGNAFK